MRLHTGDDGRLVLDFEGQEVSILSNLVGQLISLLQSQRVSDTGNDDPLLAMIEVGGNEQLPRDPALARLLPDAYDDSEASRSFRQITEQGLISNKIADARSVLDSLSAGSSNSSDSDEPVMSSITITEQAVPPWVRTITALRLSIAARLGIGSEDDHDKVADQPEHRNTLLIYDWLAAIIDLIIRYHESVDEV